jgi:hypothetical protein
MKDPASSDLNRAVQQWRENLAQSPAFRGENLNELESHLCDSISTLQTRGLSAEEAFLIATRRIGNDSRLESEFGKVNSQAVWLDRLVWLLVGYQIWAIVSGALNFVANNGLYLGLYGLGYDFKTHGHALPAALFTLMQLAGIAGSLGFCGWLFCRKGPQFGRWFGSLLHHRTSWVLTFGVLYLLLLGINLLGWGTRLLLVKSMSHQQYGDLAQSQSISYYIMLLLAPAIFVGITLIVARKHFRLRQA